MWIVRVNACQPIKEKGVRKKNIKYTHADGYLGITIYDFIWILGTLVDAPVIYVCYKTADKPKR
jgi:hypothetical protein